MTVDEIKSKYQCDKRQTGQVGIHQFGSVKGFPVNFKKLDASKEFVKEYKRENRQANKPNDPLANGNAKKIRDAKALVLKELNSMTTYVKKLNDIRQIRDNLERIVPRMLGYLK